MSKLDEAYIEKFQKGRRMKDNRPKTYKGRQVEYRGEISDRESFEGKKEIRNRIQ
jgi:hypothetical protein